MLRMLKFHEKEFHRNSSRLEGLLTRHWPELTQQLDRTATLLELLTAFGEPRAVAAEPEAQTLMRQVGGRYRDATLSLHLLLVPGGYHWVFLHEPEYCQVQKEADNAWTPLGDVQSALLLATAFLLEISP